MKVTLEGSDLVIRIPANVTNPPMSKSGKSRSVLVQGKQVVVGFNAYVK